MAEEKLVDLTDRFFEDVRVAVERSRSKYDRLYYAGLHQFADQPLDYWTFLIGAADLVEDPYEGMGHVLEELDKELDMADRLRIKKFGILGPREPFFQDIASRVKAGPSARRVVFHDCSLGNLQVRHACVFIAMRDVAEKVHAMVPPVKPAKKKNRSKVRYH